MQKPPVEDSYWVEDGRFLAGRNPLAHRTYTPVQVLDALTGAGIDTFIDLTESGEFYGRSYFDAYESSGRRDGLEYYRHSILDFDVPTPESMRAILSCLSDALQRGRNVYLHCYAGLGRTGTVVGCYLVEHGLAGADALNRITELRREALLEREQSPQTPAQQHFVLNWKAG